MANHAITTTNPREAALTAIVTRINARRAAQTPPLAAITNTDYLQRRVNDVLSSYVQQERQRSLVEAMPQADRDALGVRVPEETDLGN